MTYWRATASEPTQNDLDALLGSCLELGTTHYGKHGEFYPFFFTVEAGADPEVDLPTLGSAHLEGLDVDFPEPAAMLEAARAVIRERRSELRGAATATLVTTPDGDAIQIELDHRDGYAFTYLFGQRRRRLRGPKQTWADGGPVEGRYWPTG